MSDQDPRIREMTYRLMAMAPDAPPYPQEGAMKVSDTKQRSPVMVWVAAAVAVVLLVGLPLLLFRGGDEGPTTTIAAGDTTTTAGVVTTADESTVTTIPGSNFLRYDFSIYLFSNDMRTPIGDPALVPIHLSQYHDRTEPLSAAERIGDAMTYLLAEETSDRYSTSIPEGYQGFTVDVQNGVATIDLTSEFESGGGSHAMFTRLAQVVFTVTQFPEVDSVLFSIDGQVADVFSSEGILLEGPQTREDYYGILPQIFLDTPAIGEVVESPVTISGVANVFEAVVSYEVVAGGEVLAGGTALATCGTGCWGDYRVTVDFSVPDMMDGEIVVYEVSAQDGSRINELRYPVVLYSGQDSGLNPPSEEPPQTTTAAVTSDTILPGEPFDIGPAEGDVIAVIGVAYNDVLWLRDGPGVGYEPWLGLDPLADNLVATGRHRLIPGAIWDEVVVDGVTGWVNSSYVAYLGGVEDITSSITRQMGGIPQAETMLDLGTMVAESFSQDEGGFRYEMVVPPKVGDLGEVTFDVVGLLDDAQRGWRLHIFATPSESGEGFVLESVEGTAFCGRGVTAEGWCV